MTINQFWTEQHNTMPSSKGKNNNKLQQQVTESAFTPLSQRGLRHEEDSEMEHGLKLMTSKLSSQQ